MRSGTVTFQVQYKRLGRTRRMSLGRYGILTVDQARKLAKDILAEVAKGKDPAQDRAERQRGLTVSQLGQRFIEEHSQVQKKPLSVSMDKRLLDQVINPSLGTLSTNTITRREIARFMHKQRAYPVRANRCLALLNTMFNMAETWGLRPQNSNPCRGIKKYSERSRERFLTDNEFARLGKALAESEKIELPSVLTALRLIIFTGCRKSEILNLRWADVDIESGLMVILDGKTGKRVVPLSQAAIDILQAAPRQAGNPFVCPGVKPMSHLVGIDKAWQRIRKRAGLDDARIHDLRHTFGAVGAGANFSLHLVGGLLGHAKESTTRIYAHLGDHPLKAATDEIGQRINAAMKKKPIPQVVEMRKSN